LNTNKNSNHGGSQKVSIGDRNSDRAQRQLAFVMISVAVLIAYACYYVVAGSNGQVVEPPAIELPE
jgi:hypothetical protein